MINKADLRSAQGTGGIQGKQTVSAGSGGQVGSAPQERIHGRHI
jgi:hypothetical protein